MRVFECSTPSGVSSDGESEWGQLLERVRMYRLMDVYEPKPCKQLLGDVTHLDSNQN